MRNNSTTDLAHDLVLPAVLFAALGAMSWAVRGCSGFGAVNGCVFAGVIWGTAWWFVAREPPEKRSRPYSSGWIVLALTIGIGMAGNRGWMQWPSFFEGRLQTNAAAGEFVPIPRWHGFLWLFVAGVPWAGLGACLLAWCGRNGPSAPGQWLLRIGCGVIGVCLARLMFDHLPEVFLPLYTSIKSRYADLPANPNLRRLINDNRAAMTHLGLYLGFLAAEVIERRWRNVILIIAVGLLNGLGWSLCQNWRWAPRLWPNVNFNWWRCWESCGGISIGLAYGAAYYLVNRPTKVETPSGEPNRSPNLECFALYSGLLLGLGLSVKNGLKGWANIYLGHEEHWNSVLWIVIGPLVLLCFVALAVWLRRHPFPVDFNGDAFPNAYRVMWLVLIVQNVIAQLVTGPHSSWNETAFSIYYLLLFLVSGVIVHHFHCRRNPA